MFTWSLEQVSGPNSEVTNTLNLSMACLVMNAVDHWRETFRNSPVLLREQREPAIGGIPAKWRIAVKSVGLFLVHFDLL
jgi:hypothetical protein